MAGFIPFGPPGPPQIAGIPVLPSILYYNGVVLQIMRTEEWICEPDKDFSGVDYCLNHVVIGVRAVVNPCATATISGGVVTVTGVGPTSFTFSNLQSAPPGLFGNTVTQNKAAPPQPTLPQIPVGAFGQVDTAGVTMYKLQQLLTTPRGLLIYVMGGVPVVVAPQHSDFVCDARFGPWPKVLQLLDVQGGKTCIIRFRVECWIGGDQADPRNNNCVLSNRWSAHAHVDEDWKTTVTTRGRMRLRADVLNQNADITIPTPDIFRGAALPLAVPNGFKRDEVIVVAKEDGTELDWTCIDREKVLNLTAGSPATRITGQVSMGDATTIEDVIARINTTKAVASGIVSGFRTGLNAGGIVFAVAGAVIGGATPLINTIPIQRGSFQLRAYGGPGASRSTLLNLLAGIASDRFTPVGLAVPFGAPGAPILVSLYATVSVDTKDLWVELRGEIYGVAVGSLITTSFLSKMNLSNTIVPPGAFPVLPGTPAPNPNPPGPGAGGGRGTYVGLLLEQVLRAPFDVTPANNQPSAEPNPPAGGDGDINFQ